MLFCWKKKMRVHEIKYEITPKDDDDDDDDNNLSKSQRHRLSFAHLI